MLANVRAAAAVLLLLTLLTGLAYPLAVTGAAQLLFPRQAQGSLLRRADGGVVGSLLIAQRFAEPQYLHPRGSAAGGGYDATNSSGTNLGPMDKKLWDRVTGEAAAYRRDNGAGQIPADALTQSGSGLDPDISPENARRQALRIASARRVDVAEVLGVISRNTEGRLFGFIGEPRVNVLAANRALDQELSRPR